MSTDACGTHASTQSPRRRKSFFGEEEIVVKPSTELIPDEYEHSSSDDVCFHIFREGSDDYIAEDLLRTVKSIKYQVDETHIHDLNNKNDFNADLKSIKDRSAKKSALVLVFIGYFDKNIEGSLCLEENGCVQITNIWNGFSAHVFSEMKNKPKIFIFCTSERPDGKIQKDSMRHRTMHFDQVYDFPAESDMLIVYKKIDVIDVKGIHKEEFFEQFYENITAYSKQYDIIDLLTCMHANQKFIPLVVSTLTRKFYLTPNKEREHYLSIVENHNYLEEGLKKVKEDLQKLQDAQKKKKEKKFFSFKRKVEDKPIVVKKNENAAQPPRSPKPMKSSKRLSTSYMSDRLRPRLRTQSETDSASSKPKWKF